MANTEKETTEIEIMHGNKLLPKLLLYCSKKGFDRQKMLNSEWFVKALEGRQTFVEHNFKDYGLKNPGRVDAYKALAQTEGDAIADTTLVQEEIGKTIWEGAEPIKCWRDVLPQAPADTYQVREIKGESGYYASEVAELGAPDVRTEKYTYVNVPIQDYAIRPLISNDLIDDCQFAVVDRELRKAGYAMENKFNRVVLNELLNSSRAISTNTLNPAGTHIAVSDIPLARSKIIKNNWPMVNSIVTHPTAEGYLLQDSNLSYVSYAGQGSSLGQGTIPTLMGCKPYTCTATDLASSPTWGDTTAGTSVAAIVCAGDDLASVRMRKDMSVKQYDDPIHDLVGLVLRMRYGVRVINETAGAIIYHK